MEPIEYSKFLIEKNIRQYGAKIKSRGKNEYLKIGNKEFPIYISHGMMDKTNRKKVAKIISKEIGKKETEEEVLKNITKKPNFYGERAPNLERKLVLISFLFLIGLIFFTLSKTTLTGFAINNISNTTSNIGIFVCIIGILGFLYWKFKKK